jgi:tetratricopeptide (TPR) repeat protein
VLTLAPAEAERLLPRWEKLDPTSGQPEWLRGRIAAGAGARADAIRWYEAAIAKNSRQPAYALSLAETLLQEPTKPHLLRAKTLLESAEQQDTRAAAYPFQLAAVYTAMGEAESALAAYLRALDRDPRRVEAYGALVPLARQLGRSRASSFFARLARASREQARAEMEARRMLREHPTDPEARRTLVKALLRRGDLKGAHDQLASATTPAARLLTRDRQRVRALLTVSD